MVEPLWLLMCGIPLSATGTAWTAKQQFFNPSQRLDGLSCLAVKTNTKSIRISSFIYCRKWSCYNKVGGVMSKMPVAPCNLSPPSQNYEAHIPLRCAIGAFNVLSTCLLVFPRAP
jgi:hypothetical protein